MNNSTRINLRDWWQGIVVILCAMCAVIIPSAITKLMSVLLHFVDIDYASTTTRWIIEILLYATITPIQLTRLLRMEPMRIDAIRSAELPNQSLE